LVTKNIHPKACEAAFAAVAANEQGKFWQFHNLLFSVDLNENKETFLSMAKSLNLDTMKFEKSFSSETARDKVGQSVQLGIRLNITGTPTVYINDKKVNDFRLKPMEILMNFLLEEPVLKNVN
jgi:protein-disulfide isomerase